MIKYKDSVNCSNLNYFFNAKVLPDKKTDFDIKKIIKELYCLSEKGLTIKELQKELHDKDIIMSSSCIIKVINLINSFYGNDIIITKGEIRNNNVVYFSKYK